MEKRLLIIDGNSVINRAFYALPPMNNGRGQHTNAIYGFTSMLFKMIDEYRPTHLCVAFDRKGGTFRNRQYTEYKAGRKPMPDELASQLEPLKELLDAFKIRRLEIDDYEADDIIGTVSLSAQNNDFTTFIVTGDRDAVQLASDRTTIVFTKKGISDTEEYTPERVEEIYELTPEQFIDLKGLMGDKSDNIPGIPGVGEKTGIKLLKEYKSVEGVIEHVDELKGSLKKKVEENKETAVLSKELATICREVPIDFKLDDMVMGQLEKDEVVDKMKDLNFNTLLSRFLRLYDDLHGDSEDAEEDGFKLMEFADVEEAFKNLTKDKNVYFKLVSREGNILDKRLLYAYFMNDEYELYRLNEDNIDIIERIMTDSDIIKSGYGTKEDLVCLLAYGIRPLSLDFDMEIAEYLIDSKSSTAYDHNIISEKYLFKTIKSKEELLGKGAKARAYEDIAVESLDSYFGDILTVVKEVKPIMIKKIEDAEMLSLLEDMEMPLIEVLADMEFTGIKIDERILEDLKKRFDEEIEILEKKIYGYSIREFNINSPKQLGEILFEDLGLKGGKKTKTGYSTSAPVLEKLIDAHPIIPLILEYRTVSKLNSTYVHGLSALINEKDGRIHSTFNQTITTTGRISSTEPNLQNIPVRMEMGRELRRAFVSEEGSKLIDADYSQVELRVLAHMSGDEHMLQAFENGEDIHRTTAARVFNIDFDDVTSEQRGAAKAVNFGIIYGKTDFGLAKDLNISLDMAKNYIESYFAKYPGIKTFMDDIVGDAEKNGYAKTIFNRRRYIPEIMSTNFMDKNRGKRAAMNAPIQGSAADIIKLAMVDVYRELKKNSMKSKLILQVHDELIVESPADEVEAAGKILRDRMEGAVSLRVKLDADLNVGESWYETK